MRQGIVPKIYIHEVGYLNLNFSCILPSSTFQGYLAFKEKREKLPEWEATFRITKDTRLKQRLNVDLFKIKMENTKYNPPFLFGKSFMANFQFIKFVIKDSLANDGSYYEFEVKPEMLLEK